MCGAIELCYSECKGESYNCNSECVRANLTRVMANERASPMLWSGVVGCSFGEGRTH